MTRLPAQGPGLLHLPLGARCRPVPGHRRAPVTGRACAVAQARCQPPPGYVDISNKKMHYLGERMAPERLDPLSTRMFFARQGWSLGSFAAATGMRCD
ncbi:hypothetical protein ACFODQ_02915 [Comamonas sp. JC664]